MGKHSYRYGVAKLIARNFIDFLRLLITTKSVFGLMSEEDDETDDNLDFDPTGELYRCAFSGESYNSRENFVTTAWVRE
ncbi:hypothetical protein [Paenibacillus tarimensis]|uniref:hypothetical protein n=1 Tax=Paenibacillus tarimensis TaxID=416012 RepID=UPI001F335CF8|nr:hypothetical protein [Paenibacillus tarimensis]MCF2942767.1 hypothetical protein [Paenibacillus tarimensis]